MFKKLSTTNPLWIIIPGVFIGLAIIVGLIGSAYLAYGHFNSKNDPFSQRYIASSDQSTKNELNNYNNNNPVKQQVEMQKEALKQMQEMQQLQKAMFGNTISMNTPSLKQLIPKTTQSNISFKEQPDKYVITLNNLNNKKFNIDINKKGISIKLKTENKNKHSMFSSSTSESFSFGEPVDVRKLQKETKGDNLVLIIPKLNPSSVKHAQLIR